MNIQPMNSSVSMQGKPNDNGLKNLKNKVVQKIIDAVPEHTSNE